MTTPPRGQSPVQAAGFQEQLDDLQGRMDALEAELAETRIARVKALEAELEAVRQARVAALETELAALRKTFTTPEPPSPPPSPSTTPLRGAMAGRAALGALRDGKNDAFLDDDLEELLEIGGDPTFLEQAREQMVAATKIKPDEELWDGVIDETAYFDDEL